MFAEYFSIKESLNQKAVRISEPQACCNLQSNTKTENGNQRTENSSGNHKLTLYL